MLHKQNVFFLSFFFFFFFFGPECNFFLVREFLGRDFCSRLYEYSFGTTQLPFVEAVQLVQVNQYGQKQNMPLTGLREKEPSTYSVYSLL